MDDSVVDSLKFKFLTIIPKTFVKRRHFRWALFFTNFCRIVFPVYLPGLKVSHVSV